MKKILIPIIFVLFSFLGKSQYTFPAGNGGQVDWWSITGVFKIGTLTAATTSDTLVMMRRNDSIVTSMGITQFRTYLNSGFLLLSDTASMLNPGYVRANRLSDTAAAIRASLGIASPFQGTLNITTVASGATLSITGASSFSSGTFSTTGTPLLINSTNSTGLKITLQNAGVTRGGIGATTTYSSVFYSSAGVPLATINNTTSEFTAGPITGQATSVTSLTASGIFTGTTAFLSNTLTISGLSAGSAGNFVVNGGSGLLVTRTAAQVVADLAIPLASTYLPLAGGTMSGVINMGAYYTLYPSNASLVSGSIGRNATYGLTFYGIAGASSDIGFVNASGTEVYRNPTGTINSVFAGNVTGGAASFTTGAFSGAVTSSTGNNSLAFNSNAATTGYNISYRWSNTTGAGFVGVESSAGASLVTNSPAYSSVMSTIGSTALVFGINQVAKYIIDASGNNSWTGTGAFAAAVTITNNGGAFLAIDGAATGQAYIQLKNNGVNDWVFGTQVGGAGQAFRLYNYGTASEVFNVNKTTNATTFASSVTATSHITAGGTSSQVVLGDGTLGTYGGGSGWTDNGSTVVYTTTSSRKVGVGTSSPYGKFQVNDGTNVNFFTSILGVTGLQFGAINDAGTNYTSANIVGSTVSIYTTGGSGVTGTLAVGFDNSQTATFNGAIRLKTYTVATLPAGTVGMMCYVSDASGPTYNATVVGGGAVTIPVFYNGANWTCH